MLDDTLTKLEARVRNLAAVGEDKKAELAALLVTLREEVQALKPSKPEDAESIARFAELTAHEALRPGAKAELQQLSREGLSASVKGFEASHPKLVDSVNGICTVLANWGI